MLLASKYTQLQKARAAGIPTPDSWCIDSVPNVSDVDAYLATRSTTHFIVRSAIPVEDGVQCAWAGHFWSSEAVVRAQLMPVIEQAWCTNQRILTELALNAPVVLLIQPYVHHAVGGVLFSPWGVFNRYLHVEYAKEGVSAVVNGRSTSAILSVCAQESDPVALDMEWSDVRIPLQHLAAKLRDIFDYAIDCEWVWDAHTQQLVVVQVRPQTHFSGAIYPMPFAVQQRLVPSTNWRFGALSESLGKVSFLSFSLLLQLYAQSCSRLKYLGYHAEQVDFLLHLPDGTVLVDAFAEQRFFQLRTWGGFWQGLRLPTFKRELIDELNAWQPSAEFSFEVLVRLFSAWLVTNLLAQSVQRALAPPVHVYELMWDVAVPYPHLPLVDTSWEAVSAVLRAVVWFEYAKLKRQIATQTPDVAFCTWDEYLKYDTSNAIRRQSQYAQDAIYDGALIAHAVDDEMVWQSFSIAKKVSGCVCVIEQPSRYNGVLPAESIVIAPYFDTRWVARIPYLTAIMVQQGGRLSHAALVAREAQIPFYVVSATLLTGVTTGDFIELDVNPMSIRQIAQD